MLKLFCAFLSLLLFSGCSVKEEEPQFVCTATHQEFLDNGVVTGTNDYYASLNEQGLVAGVEDYTDGVLTFRSTYEYDAFGNVTRVTEERDGITEIAEYKNTLDKKGRILRQEIWKEDVLTSVREITYDRNGNETSHHAMHWHDDGQLDGSRSYTMRYDWKGNLTRQELHWDFNDEYIIWEYKDGLCIRQTSYQEETDQVTEYWEYTYDEEDRCTREARYTGDGSLELYNEYVYDEEARTKTRTCHRADGTVDKHSDLFTYDEHGNEILQERIREGEVYWRIQHTFELPEVTP